MAHQNVEWRTGWSMPVPLGTGSLFTNVFAVDQSFELRARVPDPIQFSDATTCYISIYPPGNGH